MWTLGGTISTAHIALDVTPRAPNATLTLAQFCC